MTRMNMISKLKGWLTTPQRIQQFHDADSNICEGDIKIMDTQSSKEKIKSLKGHIKIQIHH